MSLTFGTAALSGTLLAVAAGACAVSLVPDASQRTVAAVLVATVLAATLTPDVARALGEALSRDARTGRDRAAYVAPRLQAALIGALGVALLAAWQSRLAFVATTAATAAATADYPAVPHTFMGGGGVNGGSQWFNKLPGSANDDERIAGHARRRHGPPPAHAAGGDASSPDPEIAMANARIRKTAAREAHVIQLERRLDQASTGSNVLLGMPLLLAAAAVVPIVIASRMSAPPPAPTERFVDSEGADAGAAESEDGDDRHAMRTLAIHCAVAFVGIVVVAVLMSLDRPMPLTAWLLAVAAAAVLAYLR